MLNMIQALIITLAAIIAVSNGQWSGPRNQWGGPKPNPYGGGYGAVGAQGGYGGAGIYGTQGAYGRPSAYGGSGAYGGALGAGLAAGLAGQPIEPIGYPGQGGYGGQSIGAIGYPGQGSYGGGGGARFAPPVAGVQPGYGYAYGNEGYKPFRFGYNTVDEYGTQMGRQEVADGSGTVRGSYSYRDPYGQYRQVQYVADQGGFRAVVNTNEAGVVPHQPADAIYNVQ